MVGESIGIETLTSNHQLQCLTEHHLPCLLIYLSCDRLEVWLIGNMVADFCHEISCQITDLIMADRCETSKGIRGGLYDCE